MRRLPSRSPARLRSRLAVLPMPTPSHRPAFRQVSATPGPVLFRLRCERGTRPGLAENQKAFDTKEIDSDVCTIAERALREGRMNIPETYDYLVRARRDLWARLESVRDEVLSRPLLSGS